jgi:ribose transport system permease protein
MVSLIAHTLFKYRIYVLLLGTLLLLAVIVPGFATVDNARNVLQRASIAGLMALGLTVAILAGQLDLSVASMMALGGVVMMLLHQSFPPEVGIAAALAVGIALGVLNGVLVAKVGISAFIVTLGAMIGLRGLAFALSSSAPIGGTYPGLSVAVDQILVGPLTPRIVVFLATGLLVHLLLTRTRPGRNVFATGGNPEAARLIGIHTSRYVIGALALSGALSALAGILLALSLNTGSPVVGQQDLVVVIAAVLIGGTSLAGGRGSAMGTLAGVIFLAALTTGMNLANVPSYYQLVAVGVILVFVILLDAFDIRRQRSHGMRSKRRMAAAATP